MQCSHPVKLKLLNLVLRFVRILWNGVHIGRGSELHCPFVIGRGTWISDRFCLKGYGTLRIGKYCAIGADVKIITSNHDDQLPSMHFVLQSRVAGSRFPAKIGEVRIGHDVWIGDNVVILAGVEIGNGAVIGAGAIVSRPVGAYEIHAGNPARRIRDRLDRELAQAMQQLAWWDWSEDRMRRNRAFFASPVSRNGIDAVRP